MSNCMCFSSGVRHNIPMNEINVDNSEKYITFTVRVYEAK